MVDISEILFYKSIFIKKWCNMWKIEMNIRISFISICKRKYVYLYINMDFSINIVIYLYRSNLNMLPWSEAISGKILKNFYVGIIKDFKRQSNRNVTRLIVLNVTSIDSFLNFVTVSIWLAPKRNSGHVNQRLTRCLVPKRMLTSSLSVSCTCYRRQTGLEIN